MLLRETVVAVTIAQSLAGCWPAPTGANCDTDNVLVSNRFDIDSEGWTATGDYETGGPAFAATGGNPGGFIYVDDRGAGSYIYFVAPPQFLGDQSAALDKTLRFDLRSGVGSDRDEKGAEVILQGATLSIRTTISPAPDSDWRSYCVVLNETGGWVIASRPGTVAATRADISNVLRDLVELRIRGEYNSHDYGAEAVDLDNVIIGD